MHSPVSCPQCSDEHRERSVDRLFTETAMSQACVGCIQKAAVDLKGLPLKESVTLMRLCKARTGESSDIAWPF